MESNGKPGLEALDWIWPVQYQEFRCNSYDCVYKSSLLSDIQPKQAIWGSP